MAFSTVSSGWPSGRSHDSITAAKRCPSSAGSIDAIHSVSALGHRDHRNLRRTIVWVGRHPHQGVGATSHRIDEQKRVGELEHPSVIGSRNNGQLWAQYDLRKPRCAVLSIDGSRGTQLESDELDF